MENNRICDWIHPLKHMTMNSVILHWQPWVFHFVWSLSFECCPHRPVQIFPSCNNQTTVLCGSMREIHNKISLKICIVMTPLAILTAKFNEHTLKKLYQVWFIFLDAYWCLLIVIVDVSCRLHDTVIRLTGHIWICSWVYVGLHIVCFEQQHIQHECNPTELHRIPNIQLFCDGYIFAWK